ncbi:MAG: YdbH domain-containing protein [Pseudomonadota bacterium]
MGTLLCIALLTAWIARKPIAAGAVKDWCDARDWTCRMRFVQLTPGRVALSDIAVVTQSGTPVEADSIEIGIAWSGLFRPDVSAVTMDNPVIRGELTDEGIGLFGLEDLLANEGGGGGSAAPIPSLDIRGGRLVLKTPGGDAEALFEASGTPFVDGKIGVSLPSQSFRDEAVSLDWSGGDIILDFGAGETTGEIMLDVGEASFAGVSIGTGALQVSLSDDEGELRLVGSLSAADVITSEGTTDTIDGTLSARLDIPGGSTPADVMNALKSFSITVEAENASVQNMTVSNIIASTDLSLDDGERLSGPVSLSLDSLAGPVAAETITLLGDIRAVRQNFIGSEFDGALDITNGSISPELISPRLDILSLPAPFDLHGDQLKKALNEAGAAFSTKLTFQSAYTDTGMELVSRAPIKLETASGFDVSATPMLGRPLVRVSEDGLSARGQIDLSGGGSPSLRFDLEQLSYSTSGDIDANIGDLDLAPWTVSGRSVSVQLEEAEVSTGSALQAMIRGSAEVSGDFPGARIASTSVSGGLQAEQEAGLWHVTTLGDGCIDFKTGGMTAGELIFAPLELDLCPLNRQILSQKPGAATSRLNISAIDIDFTTAETTGALNLTNASVSLLTGAGIRVDFKGERMDLPLELGDTTLSISGEDPAVFFAADGGPLKFGARLGQTRFGGNLLPFRVGAETFTFDAASSADGIAGRLDMARARISDPHPDPLFEPIVADLSGTLDDLYLTLGGDIRIEALATSIAEVALAVDVASLTGTANVSLKSLDFQPGTLRPTDLSERLRGVLTDAIGNITGAVDFDIREGDVSGTGFVEVSGLAFKTFSFGTISGVDGRIEFSDALGVVTPPDQQIRIADMDIGLPLRDGVIAFQLKGPTEARLQGARWPLAGGSIEVQPTEWNLDERTHAVTVTAEGVELEQLVDVLAVPNLDVTGTVSGTFPVDIEGANIYVRNARFVADAPGGKLSYVGDETDAVAAGNQYAEYAFEALKGLNYTVMELGANGNLIGDLIVTADIVGRNPDVLAGSEFKFGITIDSRLAELLSSLRGAPLETYASEAYQLIEENQGVEEK